MQTVTLESLFSISSNASIFVLELAVMYPTAKICLRSIIKGVLSMVFNVGKYSIKLTFSSPHIIWLHDFNGCLKPLP